MNAKDELATDIITEYMAKHGVTLVEACASDDLRAQLAKLDECPRYPDGDVGYYQQRVTRYDA